MVATVTNPVDIPGEIFVLKVGLAGAGDTYDRIATPYDIQTFPSIKDESLGFYRVSTATLEFTDIDTASKARESIQTSVKRLLDEYSTAQTSFVGVFDLNLVSGA
jgi:hypothetical protein